jgi:CIC family chloride channel protein
VPAASAVASPGSGTGRAMKGQLAVARWLSARLDELRLHLARPDALIGLSLLGLCTGVVAGSVIVAFRLVVESAQEALLPGSGAENYEALPGWARLLLPLVGGLLLAAMFRWGSRGTHTLGVARVMERMAYHQGHFTVRGVLLQFTGAALAIVSGFSVGREGPHVFLGAASGSLLGQRFSLPNNTIRTLAACGTAAGIGASFSTPLAGVAFALEVVMMEYTVASFIPVILASVTATTLANSLLGTDVVFSLPVFEVEGASAMLDVALLGIIVGAISAGFNHALERTAARLRPVAIERRMLLAAIGMGAIGLLVPEVMGIGYDTVQRALAGELALSMVALLLLAKLTASCIALGSGVPGGVIGPSLFIGAMTGALVAGAGSLLLPGADLPVGAFALVGMGAAMSASLQAPLAGLTAMLELTDQPGVILPGMLAVVASGITAREIFGKESLFLMQLKAAGLDYRSSPLLQALRRRGVASTMNRGVERLSAVADLEICRSALQRKPEWLLIDTEGDPRALMPAVDLARYIESGRWREEPKGDDEQSAIRLLEIPAQRRSVAAVHLQATLAEALDQLDSTGVDALFVQRMTAPGVTRVYGILTRSMIERAYHE